MASRTFERAAPTLHNGCLLLTPDDPIAQTSNGRLSELLREIGLLGTALDGADDIYHSGPGLFELIAFTGCAVQLDANGEEGTGLCVRLEGPLSMPKRRTGRNTRPPRCPHCRHPLGDWRQQLDIPETDPNQEVYQEHLWCRECDIQEPGWAWSWGRHGGYGSIFVVLEPVFPGEGRPLPKLFSALEAAGLGPWHHFYVQD